MTDAMVTTVQATAYIGRRRHIEKACDVELIAEGVGRVPCFECGGTGDWTPYHPEPETGPYQCVECKGTGKALISM